MRLPDIGPATRPSLPVDPLPDVVILKGIDAHLVDLMRMRIRQARERISRIDPTKNVENVVRDNHRVMCSWSWYTPSRESIHLAEKAEGCMRLSFGATSEIMNFAFLDQTVTRSRPDDVALDTRLGLEMVDALLERFDGCASLPLIRAEQTRQRIRITEADKQPVDPAGIDYRRSINELVRRYEMLHAQYGAAGLLPGRVRLTPPAPGRPGNLMGPHEKLSLLTADGRRLLSQGVVTALTLGTTSSQDFVLDVPGMEIDQIPTQPVDAVQALRKAAGMVTASRPETLLAPRLRRR